jgi:hypothetical protein
VTTFPGNFHPNIYIDILVAIRAACLIS